MKLALMQPYFFPYLSYFELIFRSDRFIYFDTVQFKKGGWINRNRVMKEAGEWTYLTVPLSRHALSTAICEVRISESTEWRTDLLRKLNFYNKSAPNFSDVTELFWECITEECEFISQLNVRILDKVCRYLEIPIHYEYFSQMEMDIEPIKHGRDWALKISKAMGATEYINLPGGASIYLEDEFESEGIKLTLLSPPDLKYSCGPFDQIDGLSILDVMMWVKPAEIRSYFLHRSGDLHIPKSVSEYSD